MANIDKNLVENLKELGYIVNFYDNNVNQVEPEKATEISVIKATESIFDFETVKLPKKKLVDLDYVISKMNQEYVYKSFAENFSKLVKYTTNEDINVNAYPATYGIGVFVAVGFRDKINHTKETIKNFLEGTGIEYSSEYSDAGWVFRYRISKKKENIEIIDAMLQQAPI